jgi:hypothetical protein
MDALFENHLGHLLAEILKFEKNLQISPFLRTILAWGNEYAYSVHGRQL